MKLHFQVATTLGVPSFLTLYLGAGLMSSAAHLFYCSTLMPMIERRTGHRLNRNLASIGASGATLASAVMYAALFPGAQILLFMVRCRKCSLWTMLVLLVF